MDDTVIITIPPDKIKTAMESGLLSLEGVRVMHPEIFEIFAQEFFHSGLDLNDPAIFQLVQGNVFLVSAKEASTLFTGRVSEALMAIKWAWVYFDREKFLGEDKKRGLIKPYPSLRNRAGKVIKYLSFPAQFSSISIIPEPDRNDETVYITEGLKKTLALISLGFDSIGVQGVFNTGQRFSPEEIYGSPEIIKKIKGKKVVLCFDSDYISNRQVFNALVSITEYLKFVSSDVKIAHWEFSESLKGIDDFLFNKGKEQTLELLNNPITYQKFLSLGSQILKRDQDYIDPDCDSPWDTSALTEESRVAEIHQKLFTTIFDGTTDTYYQFNYVKNNWARVDSTQLFRQFREIWARYTQEENMSVYTTKLITTLQALKEVVESTRNISILVCKDAVLEFRGDGQIIPHEMNREIAKRFFVDSSLAIPQSYYYEPTADDQKLWDKFSDILPPEILEYVLTINALALAPSIAYSVLGRQIKFLFHYGSGANGKDLLRKIILACFPHELIGAISLQNLGKDFGLEPYLKTSISWSSENISKDLTRLEVLKNLVTQDEVEVRRKYKSSIRHKFSLIANFNTNHTLKLSDLQQSMDRYALIVYPNTYVKENEYNNAPNVKPRYHFSDEEMSRLSQMCFVKMLHFWEKAIDSKKIKQPPETDFLALQRKDSLLSQLIEDGILAKGGCITLERLKLVIYQHLEKIGDGVVIPSTSGVLFQPHDKNYRFPKTLNQVAELAKQSGFKPLLETKIVLKDERKVRLFSVGGLHLPVKGKDPIEVFHKDFLQKNGQPPLDEKTLPRIWKGYKP